MAAVTVQDVRHVAALARLGLTDERARELTTDLNIILDHMDVLAKVDTEGVGVGGGGGLSSGSDTGMRLREDKGPATPLVEPPEAFAPELRAGLFIVPRLSTHEDAEPAA